MKYFNIIAPLLAGLFLFGCATGETPSTQDEVAPTVGGSEGGALDESGDRSEAVDEGPTGSGLLMERYKSGEISGYRE